jgi:hypothetical protein
VEGKGRMLHRGLLHIDGEQPLARRAVEGVGMAALCMDRVPGAGEIAVVTGRAVEETAGQRMETLRRMS